nr:extracellular matrix/biofilm biosynthesis regulator RemA family protein [Pseudoflavonifractor capillosus]
MYLGQNVMMPDEDIVGIFDLDNTTWSHRTRKLLDRAEEEGRVIFVGEDLPRSFIVCETEEGEEVVFLSQFNTATLAKRAASNPWTVLDASEK